MEQIETLEAGFWSLFENILKGTNEPILEQNIFTLIKNLQQKILELHKTTIGVENTVERERVSSELLEQIVKCNAFKRDSIQLSYCPYKPWYKPKPSKLLDYDLALTLVIELYHRIRVRNDTVDISHMRRIDDKLWEVLNLLLKFILAWNHCTLRNLALLRYQAVNPENYELERSARSGLFNSPPFFM
jgi:hypothetical protein